MDTQRRYRLIGFFVCLLLAGVFGAFGVPVASFAMLGIATFLGANSLFEPPSQI